MGDREAMQMEPKFKMILTLLALAALIVLFLIVPLMVLKR